MRALDRFRFYAFGGGAAMVSCAKSNTPQRRGEGERRIGKVSHFCGFFAFNFLTNAPIY
jgi:hypothetical protein